VTVCPHPLGCVLWFDFGEPKGNIACDLSGMGNNGTIYGAARVVGPLSGALSFDGVDDYVEVLDTATTIHPLKTKTGTIEFVGKLWEVKTGINTLIRIGEWPTVIQTTDDGKGIMFTVRDLEGFKDVVVYSPVTFEWGHYVLAWREYEKMAVYRNGNFIGERTLVELYPFDDKPICLGSTGGRTYFSKSMLALVRIYSRVLTKREIRAHYNYVRSAIVPEV